MREAAVCSVRRLSRRRAFPFFVLARTSDMSAAARRNICSDGRFLFLNHNKFKSNFFLKAIENKFVPHDTVDSSLKSLGFDAKSIASTVLNLL